MPPGHIPSASLWSTTGARETGAHRVKKLPKQRHLRIAPRAVFLVLGLPLGFQIPSLIGFAAALVRFDDLVFALGAVHAYVLGVEHPETRNPRVTAITCKPTPIVRPEELLMKLNFILLRPRGGVKHNCDRLLRVAGGGLSK